ncbi:MAG: pteridine reductase [Gammaproteobacteria bacterium RIFCSPHIGHO2_12_FULL_37_14]|nr:MAG: pteridine reductase [Gammaproteobacteria bacterium RIFCSPHIGHO2_12_FULL_37_14]
MSKHSLTSKVAIITGAARRIGAEIARTLHAAGMNVVLHYNISEEEAITLSQQFNQKRNSSAIALRADLQDFESGKAFIQQAANTWKRLDVLINNASRFYRTAFGKITEYAWDDLMNSNLKAPFFLSQAAAQFLAENQGSIINITDAHIESPSRDYSVYSISKSGLVMLTKVLAKELGPAIRVNAIAPGVILWPEGENALPEAEKQTIIEKTLLKRIGQPEDIAKAVLFFIQDADYVTGQMLSIDGGRMLCRD